MAVVIDHFSRRAMGFAVFKKDPDSQHIRSFLGRAMHQAQARPKYLICDQGKQFWCEGFKNWCRRKGIRPRYGAVGQHGSIAVVERFIQTVKVECTRRLAVSLHVKKLVPQQRLPLCADPCRGFLLVSLWVVKPFLADHPSHGIGARARSPGSQMTQNTAAESGWTSTAVRETGLEPAPPYGD